MDFSSLFSHTDNRWDGEYLCFEPYKNPSLQYVPIGDTLKSSQYGVSIEMNEDGIGTKIYRMNEISNVLADSNVSKYAQLDAEEIDTYRLNDRDVLFNRTNSLDFVGRTGIFRKFLNEDVVFASYLVRLIPDPNIVTPEYLTAFLNTKYGVLDVKRRARISINQSNVNPEELKRVEIPLVSSELQQKITRSFDSAFSLIQSSEAQYQEAEALLLSELGLADWQPKRQTESVRNFSDVWAAGRMDAEYYQPKYDDIVDAIKGYTGGWDTMGELVSLKDKNFKPDNTTEYRYIELANISGSGEISDYTIAQGNELPSRARRRVSAGDVIVSSIEGSLDSVAMIDDEHVGALCSTGFHVVHSQALNSETLLVLLKSIAGQLQLKKGCSGTILAAISKDEFRKVVLPLVSYETQAEIQRKVAESAALRRQSRELLECAKRAVEIAIEQDEAMAVAWLDAAVADAYGWDAELTDEQVLERLLALNLERYEGETG